MSASRLRQRLWVSAAALSLANFTGGAATAQNAPAQMSAEEAKQLLDLVWGNRNRDAKKADVFQFDYDVPTSPELTLLDAEQGKIAQSNSLKPFILSVPSIAGSNGTGQAIALNFSPAWLMQRSEDRTYGNYTGTTAFWYRTRVGIAVGQGVTDTDPAKQRASRLSVGVSTSLFETSDPLLAHVPGYDGSAWDKCVTGSQPVISRDMPKPDETPDLTDIRTRKTIAFAAWHAAPTAELERKYYQLEAEYQKQVDEWLVGANAKFATTPGGLRLAECLVVADRAAKTGLDVDLGGGAVWEGDPGKVTHLDHPAAVFWTSFRVPLIVGKPTDESPESLIEWSKAKSWVMVGGSGRAGLAEAVATGDSAKPKIRADSFTGWLGLDYNLETTRVTGQIGLRRISPRVAADSAFGGTQTVYLFGLDQKLNDTVWLTATYGWADGTGALKRDSVLKVGVTVDTRRIFGN